MSSSRSGAEGGLLLVRASAHGDVVSESGRRSAEVAEWVRKRVRTRKGEWVPTPRPDRTRFDYAMLHGFRIEAERTGGLLRLLELHLSCSCELSQSPTQHRFATHRLAGRQWREDYPLHLLLVGALASLAPASHSRKLRSASRAKRSAPESNGRPQRPLTWGLSTGGAEASAVSAAAPWRVPLRDNRRELVVVVVVVVVVAAAER